MCLGRFSSCSDIYFHESATLLYKLNKHFSKHDFVRLLGKLRLISMGLLRKVSKGPLGVPGQQSVLARAKKFIKETASLTSHNVFTISIFIKHVKECDHKAFQGLTALVYWFFLFLNGDKSQVLNMLRCLISECEEWLADLGDLFWMASSILCLITPSTWQELTLLEVTSNLLYLPRPKARMNFL